MYCSHKKLYMQINSLRSVNYSYSLYTSIPISYLFSALHQGEAGKSGRPGERGAAGPPV